MYNSLLSIYIQPEDGHYQEPKHVVIYVINNIYIYVLYNSLLSIYIQPEDGHYQEPKHVVFIYVINNIYIYMYIYIYIYTYIHQTVVLGSRFPPILGLVSFLFHPCWHRMQFSSAHTTVSMTCWHAKSSVLTLGLAVLLTQTISLYRMSQNCVTNFSWLFPIPN